MHRQSHEEVSAAAQRRLELLGRELEQAGLRRIDEGLDEHAGQPPGPLPGPRVVAPAGRHLRGPRRGRDRRWGDRLAGLVPETLRGPTELARPAVLLVVALVALGVIGTVHVVLRSRSEPVPVPAAGRAPTSGAPLVSTTPSPTSAASAAAVTVDVAGKVRRPGVRTLPAGSRVVDAVRRAGGARRGVDLGSLNLARVLVDGEQVFVGGPVPAGGIAAGTSTRAPDPPGALVDLNTATGEELETLPGVGPVTAEKILDWRAAHGAFAAVDELLEVDGIGEKTLAEIAPHATV